ncbi:hypothetical protein APS56_14375 [Pseudalgibacter alginicilyticus]|uniref:DUF192 domain-containing protein n=1 Tax=Pseudalgibacter alginicilyticus TaxID=1736674 RepID=A0A0P0CTP8_9FLAO|nr:DUF192 domain-containing protein [Pseudalgibacter alginicilyticus]ALJ06249.1 hypothetical protein APS56_14375 [Pseudalgibacter alginicilyticus]
MHLKTISFLIIFSLICLSHQSCRQESKTIKQTEVTFKKEADLTIYKSNTDSIIKKLDIELAETDYDIQTGLMYRDTMKENQGMLFIFEDETERFFYMKNTRFSLDLIYINANKKIVSFQKNAKPFDEASLPSNAPAKYVLEINAGMVDAWKVSVGDDINFTRN